MAEPITGEGIIPIVEEGMEEGKAVVVSAAVRANRERLFEEGRVMGLKKAFKEYMASPARLVDLIFGERDEDITILEHVQQAHHRWHGEELYALRRLAGAIAGTTMNANRERAGRFLESLIDRYEDAVGATDIHYATSS
jgi:hypothetical protein